MKLILDDGQEISFEDVKVIEAKKNQVIIIKVYPEIIKNKDIMPILRDNMSRLFAPAKTLIMATDNSVSVIEKH